MFNLFQLFMGFMVCGDRDKWLNSEQIRNSNNYKMKGVNLNDGGADAAWSAEGCFPAVVLTHYSSHTLSWQLAIVFVTLGMAGVNTTLLEHINFHAPPRFPSSKLFPLAHFQKIAKRRIARLQVKDTFDDSDTFSQRISRKYAFRHWR